MSPNKPVTEGLSQGTPHKGCRSFLVGQIMRAPSAPSKAQTDTTLRLKIFRHGLQQTVLVSVKSCGCCSSAELSNYGNVCEPRQQADSVCTGWLWGFHARPHPVLLMRQKTRRGPSSAAETWVCSQCEHHVKKEPLFTL